MVKVDNVHELFYFVCFTKIYFMKRPKYLVADIKMS